MSSSSPPPPSAAQAQGPNGSNTNRGQISNSGGGSAKKKRSRTRRRDNSNKLMPVKLLDTSSPLPKPAEEGGGGSQALISQTLASSSSKDQQRQQSERDNISVIKVCKNDNDNDSSRVSNDNGTTITVAADRDNGDVNGDDIQCQRRHRQTDLIEKLEEDSTRARHEASSNSSSSRESGGGGPVVGNNLEQSQPVARQDHTTTSVEPLGESENNNNNNNNKTRGSHSSSEQSIVIDQDKKRDGQTRAETSSQQQQATALVPTSSSGAAKAQQQSITLKQLTAANLRIRPNPHKRPPQAAPASIIGPHRGNSSRSRQKQQRSGGAMAESAVLVPVGAMDGIENDNDDAIRSDCGPKLVGLVTQLDRKLSQSSSGHETGSHLADFTTNSASAWSTPIMTNSRRSSSYAVCVDIELNECDSNNRSNNKILTNSTDNHYNTSKTSAAAVEAPPPPMAQLSTAGSIRKSWSATDCTLIDHELESNDLSSKLLAHGRKMGRNKHLNNTNNGPSSGSTPPLKRRSISRSMLELDPCVGVNEKFLVYWKNLTFGYPPGLLTRHISSSKVARRLGGRNNKPAAANNASSRQNHENAIVLNNVSGTIGSNQLVAIIGPSGCGKTTLLQFLAGNNGHQQEALRICGLGEPKVAFIGQDDSLLPGLTARETLMYASRLQNSAPNFDHANHIEPILAELGLLECANRCVPKLSGGQAKRVTIAQELLYPTNLLILDEVTSGLDASTSYSIIKLLKYLVSDSAYPMSIVISIHQPSARLFSVFDKVYVMSSGCCLYEGSCNLAKINAHLARFNLECPRYHNIADYLIELACLSSSSSSSGAGAGPEAEVPPLSANGAGDDGQDYANDDAEAGVDEPFLQANGKVTAGGASATKLTTSSCCSVLDQMIAYQRKQSESSIEQLRQQQQQQTTTGGDLEVDALEHSFSSPNGDGDDFQINGQLALGPTIEASLYLAIEQARQRRPKPFVDHFEVHFERSLARIRRSYILTYLQLITYIILGVQLATFYGADIGQVSGCPRLPKNLMTWILSSNSGDGDSKTDGDSDSGGDMAHEIRRIQENMNFLLVTVMTATFAALEITVITFPMEAKTIKREWRNGWYRVSSYFMGRTLADLPFQLAFVMIFCLLIYIMTGQLGLTTWRFASFVLIIVMTALIAQSIGLIFGALFMNNLPAAVFTAPLAIFPTLLFSGFFSRVSQVSAFYRPLTYLSHFRYAFDALLVTLYGFDRCNCDQAVLTGYHASMANQTSSMREMFHLLFGASDCISAASTTTTAAQTSPLASPTTPPLSLADILNPSAAPPGDANTIADSSGGAGGLASAGLVSHEDLAAIQAGNQSLASALMSIIKTTTTAMASTAAATTTTTMAPLSSTAATLLNAANGSAGGGTNPSESYKQFEDMLVDTVFAQMSSASSGSSLLSNDTSGSGSGGADGGGEQTSVMDRLADKFATKLTAMLNRQSNFGHPMPTECKRFNSYLLTEFDLGDDDLLFGLSMLFVAVVLTRLLCNAILHFTIATRIR